MLFKDLAIKQYFISNFFVWQKISFNKAKPNDMDLKFMFYGHEEVEPISYPISTQDDLHNV